MKTFLAAIALLPLVLALLLILAIAVAMQQGMVSRSHKVTGPAWAQIAGKFRGEQQEQVVAALTRSVLTGSVGTWGQVPMPAHPQLSNEQATAAVAYILNVDEQESNLNTPRDTNGRPYVATLDYDVLPRLTSLHPSFQLENLAPPGFEPKVGGMAFRDDGKLVIASWDQNGAVFLVDPNAPAEQRVRRIAEGLHEPLGLSMVDDRLFVLQKQELTELIDTDGDEVIDRYRAVSYDWPSSSNFHSFAFGLLHQDDHFYFPLSICVLPGGASCPQQLPTQGKLLRADSTGKVGVFAADRRSLRLRVPGLKAGYVVYLRLNDRMRSATDNKLWTAEAWYTLNAIPGGATAVPLAQTSSDGWRDLFDGQTLTGWRNYGRDASDIRKWTVQDGTLALVQEGPFPMWDLIKSVIFGGPSGDLIYYREKFLDFELSLQWKISPGGNSGIFYLVKDETENAVWRTGVEMQVLDNDVHADGQIKNHRAGDLYDLIAANPETVRPPGEWNDVLIRVKDNHIEHWLNGVKVLSVERGSSEWDALVAASKFADMPGFGKSEAGYIALQDHGDPVWYRNIRVRKL